MHILKYPEVFLHIHCLGIFYILPNFQNVFNLKFSVSVFQYYLPGPLQLAELSGWCDWSPLVVGLGSGATRESHTSHRLHHQQLLDMETSTVLVHGHKPCADVFHKQIGVFFYPLLLVPKTFSMVHRKQTGKSSFGVAGNNSCHLKTITSVSNPYSSKAYSPSGE